VILFHSNRVHSVGYNKYMYHIAFEVLLNNLISTLFRSCYRVWLPFSCSWNMWKMFLRKLVTPKVFMWYFRTRGGGITQHILPLLQLRDKNNIRLFLYIKWSWITRKYFNFIITIWSCRLQQQRQAINQVRSQYVCMW